MIDRSLANNQFAAQSLYNLADGFKPWIAIIRQRLVKTSPSSEITMDISTFELELPHLAFSYPVITV